MEAEGEEIATPRSHECCSQAWTHYKPPSSTSPQPTHLQVYISLLPGMPESVLSHKEPFLRPLQGQALSRLCGHRDEADEDLSILPKAAI